MPKLTGEELYEKLEKTAGFVGYECLEPEIPIFAYRFKEELGAPIFDYVENFFVTNFSALRRLGLHTKAIGSALLIFPKKVDL